MQVNKIMLTNLIDFGTFKKLKYFQFNFSYNIKKTFEINQRLTSITGVLMILNEGEKISDDNFAIIYLRTI